MNKMLIMRMISSIIDIFSVILGFVILKIIEEFVCLPVINFIVLFFAIFLLFIFIPFQDYQYHQTIGKRIMSIRLEKENGSKLTLGDSFLRYIFNALDIFTFFIIRIPLIYKTGKSVSDLIVKTKIV